MKEPGASRTAYYVALYRALESEERARTPLFHDPFARAFLPRRLRLVERLARAPIFRAALMRYADRRAPGARSSAIGRTRFIDDFVRREVEQGAEQLVLLGAGYDCRAHRMSELRGVTVFEVDRAATQLVKRRRIARESDARARHDVVYVPVDFSRDDAFERLERAGWRRDGRTIFIWEGVTNYLTEPDVAHVLAAIGRAAPASAVVFTYVHRGVIDASVTFEGADKVVENVKRLGEPWRFGIIPSELGAFVERFGLALEENLGADEYRARYMPGDDSFRGYAFYRIAVARVSTAPSPDRTPDRSRNHR